MVELNIATGLITYSLNGVYDLTINPTDSNFVERLYAAFETLDEKQDEYRAAVQKASVKEVFEIAKRCDEEMRVIVDSVVGDGACNTVFGNMNVYSIADGLPVWSNLLLAILDIVDDEFTKQEKMSRPRIEKYTKKYHK